MLLIIVFCQDLTLSTTCAYFEVLYSRPGIDPDRNCIVVNGYYLHYITIHSLYALLHDLGHACFPVLYPDRVVFYRCCVYYRHRRLLLLKVRMTVILKISRCTSIECVNTSAARAMPQAPDLYASIFMVVLSYYLVQVIFATTCRA